MTIDVREMRQVAAIANEGSFARAAKVLHISQPALSRSIQEVESGERGQSVYIDVRRFWCEVAWTMARQRRVGFEGALYHVMARSDRREPIVLDDDERKAHAQKLFEEGCAALGIDANAQRLKKTNDKDKVMLAALIADQTRVPLAWLCEALGMGSRSNCSRLINAERRNVLNPRRRKSENSNIAIYTD